MSAEPIAQPLRVTLADDHPPTRAGIRRALETAGWEVCAESPDAKAAYEMAVAHRPDVVLLDIHMPGSGVAAAERISNELPDTSVVMLTVSRNDVDLFAALRAGASGYLLKDIDPDRLSPALEGVLRGEAALPRNLVARLMEEFRGRGRRRMTLPNRKAVNLTSREWEVLELMGQGLRTADIAERLQVSAVTVRTHVSSILRKLHVPDRAAAVKLLAER
ncbi:MAG TPA: response regulator transcription factor [Egibacteraceae bacterium]|nr:response regulator transcription factor [Egibacteraceae bacterium]